MDTRPEIPGFDIVRSLEPPHPHCTISDPVYGSMLLGRMVAVKVLNLGFPLRAESRARFEELVRKLIRIEATSPIRVVAGGFCTDGRPYYAMEAIAGVTVAERKALADAADVHAILADVAAGLSAAIAVGLVPSIHARHILLTASGARIWNLGVDGWRSWARELVAGQYTAAGQLMRHGDLTPHEAKGLRPNPANASAQLALIAFRMMAGRPYWDADLDLDGHPMMMLMEATSNAGPPPSQRSPVALPAGFDTWFARCLAGEVADPAEAARTFPG